MQQDRLVVIWLSADRRAAADMALFYLRESLLAGDWQTAELWLWGPPVALAAQDEALLEELRETMGLGVRLSACIDCAARYGVAQRLAGEGIAVRGLSAELTALLRGREPLLLI